MNTASDWPALVRSLMSERGMSVRRLSAAARVNRSTLQRFFRDEAYSITVAQIERLLAVFGYELDAIHVGKDEGA